MIQLAVGLVDTGSVVRRVTAEGDIEVLQECIATSEQGLGCVSVGVNTRLSVENNDTVGTVKDKVSSFSFQKVLEVSQSIVEIESNKVVNQVPVRTSRETYR